MAPTAQSVLACAVGARRRLRGLGHAGERLRIGGERAERLGLAISAAMTCGCAAKAWNPGLAASARKLGSLTISSNASVCISWERGVAERHVVVTDLADT